MLKLIKFVKSLFCHKAPASKLPPLAAQGVIARKSSELFIVSLVHNGGECYEIVQVGRASKSGFVKIRYGEQRARNAFVSACLMADAQ